MSGLKRIHCIGLKVVILHFLENHRVENYHILVDDMMTAFENIDVNISQNPVFTLLSRIFQKITC